MTRTSADNMWRICVDTGGTFTDCLAVDPDGMVHRRKVLSTSALRGSIVEPLDDRTVEIRENWNAPPEVVVGLRFQLLEHPAQTARVVAYDAITGVMTLSDAMPEPPESGARFDVLAEEEAPILAARLVTGTPLGEALPPIEMRLATTRGTNALLERRGGPTVFLVTRGFRDLLVIGDQTRPDIFALQIDRPAPLPESVIEIDERLDADGRVLTPLDLDAAVAAARAAYAQGIRTAAVALLHSYRNPTHELELAAALRAIGFEHVSCSSELAPLIKILPRAETAVVDAYLAPVMAAYVDRVRESAMGGSLRVMTSAGGLVGGDVFHPKDSLLSGPAAGVGGAAAIGRGEGFTRVIGFDMGGTSTDVCRYSGEFEYSFEHRVGGVRIAAPALAVETVAAGGGSICAVRHGWLHVGPQSAGAHPGPACYGAGGPLSLTDVNLLLDRLDPDQFEIPLDAEAAQIAFAETLASYAAESDDPVEPELLLDGFLQLADERMANAIRQISLRRGYDVRDYALVAFGGAGGQHACRVADQLDISTVVMPRDASILSAVGLSAAVVERIAQAQVLEPLQGVMGTIDARLEELSREASGALINEGVARGDVIIRRRIVNARLLGQETSIQIDIDRGDEIEPAFRRRYERLYGHSPADKPIEVESIRVVTSTRATEPHVEPCDVGAGDDAAVPSGNREAWFAGQRRTVSCFERDDLRAGMRIVGPALVYDRTSTFIIESNWTAQVAASGSLIASRLEPKADLTVHSDELVQNELFMHRFSAIAEDMGRILERTAVSTNVKERRDFSCALLDHDGVLLSSAPHMPIHLGSMGICVRTVREAIEIGPGDVVITNHPAHGGSHLPDITVITPVVAPGGDLIAFVASRAHHAEIGGIRPGSMPPDASSLAEEGVIIPPMYLVEGGRDRQADVETLLRSGPHPSRAMGDNLADLAAAVAANQHGVGAVGTLMSDHGEAVVRGQMAALRKRAARLARRAIRGLPSGSFTAMEHLDDGTPIKVRIDVEGDRARFDFSGTADVHPGNLNATPAIVTGVVIYVLRILVGEALPLNEGLLEPVEIVVPAGMLNPEFPDDAASAPAVAGGNVETSQRLVDTLLRALGVCAGSQGTMNNVIFGNEGFGYYETICGGSGAGPGYDGASAVHTHMTNTLITDPEIIEHRYPVRLDRFQVRQGSAGAGAHCGGEGVVREMTFLQPVSLCVLSQHRVTGGYGLDGGEPGRPGRQSVIRPDGVILPLGAIDQCELRAGDRFLIETPGGGGMGPAAD